MGSRGRSMTSLWPFLPWPWVRPPRHRAWPGMPADALRSLCWALILLWRQRARAGLPVGRDDDVSPIWTDAGRAFGAAVFGTILAGV